MRLFLYVLALTLAATLIVSAAGAEVMLFKGEPAHTMGLSIGGWGSGVAQESSERVFTGTRSVKMVSMGLHEGARLEFKDPINLLAGPFDDSDYLQFVVGFTTIVRPGGARAPSPASGGMPGSHSSGTAFGGYAGDDFETPSRPKVNAVRVVLETQEGRGVEVTADVSAREDEGWYKISIPFKAFRFRQGESFPISRILVFTDVPEVMYLGQIGAVKDSTPITAHAGDEQVIASNDTVTFRAEADGGISPLRFAWNFGDRERDDPTAPDALGEVVKHKFTKAGDFTATLTVSDAWGVKKPVTVTTKVYVND